MTIDWIDVSGSERISAMAYVPDQQMICVRLADGLEWCYEGCSPEEFEAFSDASQSKGQYIHQVLNKKTHRKLVY
jgi:hypothetical protein